MKLPCRHIFHVRRNLGLPIYDKNLCAERWTTAHSRSQRKAMVAVEDDTPSTTDVTVTAMSHVKKLTNQQKYSRAMDVCRKLANTVALASQEGFDHRLEQLKSLNEHWSQGNEVGIQIFQENAHLSDEVPDEENGGSIVTGLGDESSESMVVDVLDEIPGSSSGDLLDKILRRIDAFEDSNNPYDFRRNTSEIIDQGVVQAITSSISGQFDENYDDDLFAFNINCVRHAVDNDVKVVLESIVDQVVDISGRFTPLFTGANDVTITQLKSIKMPPPVKVKGRPKGADQTNVIGTKKVSKKKLACQRYLEMRNADKERYMLSLCIGKRSV